MPISELKFWHKGAVLKLTSDRLDRLLDSNIVTVGSAPTPKGKTNPAFRNMKVLFHRLQFKIKEAILGD